MQKNTNILKFTLCLLAVAFLGLTIVYAALSQKLSIVGSADGVSSKWDISIKYLNVDATSGVSYTTPTITGTTIANYSANLKKPGDMVKFYFIIETKSQ